MIIQPLIADVGPCFCDLSPIRIVCIAVSQTEDDQAHAEQGCGPQKRKVEFVRSDRAQCIHEWNLRPRPILNNLNQTHQGKRDEQAAPGHSA